MINKKILLSGAVAILSSATLNAATYFVSKDATNASDSNDGSKGKPFKTISAAAAKVQPGDTVIVKPGIYRERVAPAAAGTKEQPIKFIADPVHKAVVKGSEVWTGKWKKEKGKVYSTKLNDDFFKGVINPFKTMFSIKMQEKDVPARPTDKKLMPITLGQVFVGGRKYTQSMTMKGVMTTPDSWIVSADGKKLFVHFGRIHSPKKSEVELTVRDRIFAPTRRALGYIHVKGFVFEHCANQGPWPQGGAVSVRSGAHWLIEDNIIRHAKSIGLDIGSETWDMKGFYDRIPTVEEDKKIIIGGYNTVIGNRISDNGVCGLAGWHCSGSKVINNIIERNSDLSITHVEGGGEELGGIKLHIAHHVIVKGNIVRNNYMHGIWLDMAYSNSRVTRNYVYRNRGTGIFIELGVGPCMVDNNFVANSTYYGNIYYTGIGIYTHDASGVSVINNFLLNNVSGVLMRKISPRKFGGKDTAASNEKIFNNIIVYRNNAISMPAPNKLARNNTSNNNLLIGPETFAFAQAWSIGNPPKEKLVKEVKKAGLKANSVFPEVVLAKEWNAVWKMDKYSVMLPAHNDKIGVEFKERSMVLVIDIKDPNLLKMKCRSFKGLDKDYLGKKYNKRRILPGPFQNLKPGKNYIMLNPFE